MDRAALAVTLAGLALLLAPVVYFGELGVWGFAEPISNLDWDEGGMGPAQAGGAAAGSGGSGGGDGTDDPEPSPSPDAAGGSGGGSGSEPTQEPEDTGEGGSSGSGTDGGGAGGGDGGSGPGGSGSGTGPDGSGGSGAAWGAAGSGPGSGGNQTGSGAFGSTGSAPAFHWPALAFGSLSFFLVLGGCAWWWGNAYAAFWVAFAQAMAMWAMAFCLALAALVYYILWVYLGILGGLLAAGLTLLAVYLNSQGVLFGGAAAATGSGSVAPPSPPAGEPKVVQRMPKRPR